MVGIGKCSVAVRGPTYYTIIVVGIRASYAESVRSRIVYKVTRTSNLITYPVLPETLQHVVVYIGSSIQASACEAACAAQRKRGAEVPPWEIDDGNSGYAAIQMASNRQYRRTCGTHTNFLRIYMVMHMLPTIRHSTLIACRRLLVR